MHIVHLVDQSNQQVVLIIITLYAINVFINKFHPFLAEIRNIVHSAEMRPLSGRVSVLPAVRGIPLKSSLHRKAQSERLPVKAEAAELVLQSINRSQ